MNYRAVSDSESDIYTALNLLVFFIISIYVSQPTLSHHIMREFTTTLLLL